MAAVARDKTREIWGTQIGRGNDKLASRVGELDPATWRHTIFVLYSIIS